MGRRYPPYAITLAIACSLGLAVEASASTVSLTVEVPAPDKKFEGGSAPVLQLILGSQLAVGFLTVNAPWTGGTSADNGRHQHGTHRGRHDGPGGVPLQESDEHN